LNQTKCVRLKTVTLTNFSSRSGIKFGVDSSTKEAYWLSGTSIEYNKKTSTQNTGTGYYYEPNKKTRSQSAITILVKLVSQNTMDSLQYKLRNFLG
jgi:hypothetical protein